MISVKSLVHLIGNPAQLCPADWVITHGRPCPASRYYAHECVGDAGHGGKHVCRCGALRRVGL